jgi:hypothetical protein
MEERSKVAIGTVVMRNKQYLTAIRPLDGALAMSTMRFADEPPPTFPPVWTVYFIQTCPTGGGAG